MLKIGLLIFVVLGIVGTLGSIIGIVRRERHMRQLNRNVREAGRKKS